MNIAACHFDERSDRFNVHFNESVDLYETKSK
jgi:hypothetical protein